MSDLPAGWADALLDDLALVVRGVSYSKNEASTSPGEGLVALLRATNIGESLNFEDVYYVPESRVSASQELRSGDVVVATSSGSASVVGKSARLSMDWEGTVGAFCSIVRPLAGVSSAYLAYSIAGPAIRASWSALARGSNINNLRVAHITDTRVPLPPLPEQQRIVVALAEAFSKLDAGEGGLRATRQRLKRMRESVLLAGSVGNLVPQDATDTPAPMSLADSEVGPLDTAGLPRLPESWLWASLGALAEVVGGVTKDAKSQGENDPDYVDVPYLRVANVQRGYLDLADVTRIRVASSKADRLKLMPGDVLFNEGGDRDKLGRGWVWDGQIEDCIHQNHVFRARLRDQRMLPKLVSWWGNTFGKRWFEDHGKQTTNLASLNLRTLKSFPVPVAPFEEEVRIVAEVDRELSFIEACERAVDAGLARSGALRRSILKAAFEGKLVPQDPADEPASVLLDRIRAERARAEPGGRRRVKAAT